MAGMKSTVSAALIGDVLGSRRREDREVLHATVAHAVAAVNEACPAVTPLRITVGDEYQGSYEHVGQALHAAFLLRVALLPDVDVRHGVGWGPVQVLEEEPRVEDGAAWWAARDAIVEVEAGEERASLRAVRTAYASAEGVDGPDPAAVNAALMLRDQLLGGLSPRALSVLRGLLAGRPQREIAAVEGVSASAVSQRVRKDGLAVIVAATTLLEGVR